MRLIDADSLERDGWQMCRPYQKDKSTMVYEIKKPSDFPTIEERSEPNYDEWCTDCKEYNNERHCCPRWNRVIRSTLEDLRTHSQNQDSYTSVTKYKVVYGRGEKHVPDE